ncbi:MAG: DUF1080 domain-containing protein [Fimbriimonadaceae bacterium]|nr:DUF1080 domain-containing protein [Fimbriimonadaceae bacterium]
MTRSWRWPLLATTVLLSALLAADPPAPAPAAPPVVPAVPAPPEPAGMVAMFNGRDLTGWKGDPRLWSVKDGVLRGETTAANPTKGNTFLIWTGDDQGAAAANFELRLQVRIHHGNSGVQYRSKQLDPKPPNEWVVRGYQMEVANEVNRPGMLYHEGGRARIGMPGEQVVMDEHGKKQVVGILGDLKAAQNCYQVRKVEAEATWNEYIIRCEGTHLQQWINGIQTVDLTDNDPQGRLLDGIFALQIHAGPPMWVEFKDLRLKRLP